MYRKSLSMCLALVVTPLTLNSVVIAEEAVLQPPSANAQLAERGLAWRQEVETQQAALSAAFERLDRAIALIVEGSIHGERLTVLQLRGVVSQMREQAESVVSAHRETLSAAEEYGELVRKAAPLLLAAAKRFDEYAAEEDYRSLREDYLRWGESFEAIARKYQRQAATVGPTVSAVSANLEYVERTELQLARVEELLVILPEEGEGAEEFLTRLAGYVESFGSLQKRLRDLHGKTFRDLEEKEAAETRPRASGTTPVTEKSSEPSPRLARINSQRTHPVTAPTYDKAPQPSRERTSPRPSPYLGRWNMGTSSGRVPLEFYRDGAHLRVRLAGRHSVLTAVEGDVEESDYGADLVGLVYETRSGDRLSLGDIELERDDADTLSARLPMVTGSFGRGFRITQQSTNVQLHRVR